jgi:pimeloyl-ACP methyl ester carboxylesterase
MRRSTWNWLCIGAVFLSGPAQGQTTRSIEVPLGKSGDVQVGDIVARLAHASGTSLEEPATGFTLSTQGLARAMTRTLLSECLGPEVAITFRPGVMLLSVDDRALVPENRQEWLRRLRDLSQRAAEAARHRQAYGMRALPSYKCDDPGRPTVCLVHGLNSSSGGFVHMIPWLEEAGYGIVVYDYPFNRALEESCAAFARDWAAFRRQVQAHHPWLIVAHSMGALLARSMVEDDPRAAREASSLILIAPVNGGSHLARVQTLIQFMNGVKAQSGKNTTRAMLGLSDGLGQAAQDMLPSSPFLTKLNRRPRRPGVPYHILAGDRGFLTQEARGQLEARIALVNDNAGIFGRVTKLATADMPALLDELSDGTGDGCIAVERTRLDGVTDHVTIHANHAELIRAPLLFPDPGPVACMPQVLRWLKEDRAHVGQERQR